MKIKKEQAKSLLTQVFPGTTCLVIDWWLLGRMVIIDFKSNAF